MSQIITINSINYDGELANVLFTPDNDPVVINLGDVNLPFVFEPSLLIPPRQVYGTYTIYTYEDKCTNILQVPRPTPTPTPTVTPTRTPTPTPTPTPSPSTSSLPCSSNTPTPTPTNTPTPTPTSTITPTPTPTFNPCLTSTPKPPKPSVTPTKTPIPTGTLTPTPTKTPTQTPTNTPTKTPVPTQTPTPTPTPQYTNFAYLFIEPESGSTQIGQYMYDSGSNFFGFTNASQPTQNQTQFNADMNTYVNFSGWTNGQFPSIITQFVPTTTGGLDPFGNLIQAYNFLTTEVPQNTIKSTAWYTWIIPVTSTNNQFQVEIGFNDTGNPMSLTGIDTENTIYSYTFTYTGTTIPTGIYRVYTTFPNQVFRVNNNYSIYFKGNDIQP